MTEEQNKIQFNEDYNKLIKLPGIGTDDIYSFCRSYFVPDAKKEVIAEERERIHKELLDEPFVTTYMGDTLYKFDQIKNIIFKI